MKIGIQSIKNMLKKWFPIFIYKRLLIIDKILLLSPTYKIYKIDKKLPKNFCVQRLRSIELRGISNAVLESAICDYREFTLKNYGPVVDSGRIPSLIEAVLLTNELFGDIAECGVYHGSSAKIIRHFSSPDRRLYLFDTFTGFIAEDRELEMKKGIKIDPGKGHINSSLEEAKKRIFSKIEGKNTQFNESSVAFRVSPVQETLYSVKDVSFSLVHLDMDLYAPTKFALEFFVPLLVKNGILLIHDFSVDKSGYRGVYKAFQDVDTSQLFGPLPFGDQ